MSNNYLNPKNDLAFKKLFAEETHKKLPISFLNAVLDLEGKNSIVDLKVINASLPLQIEFLVEEDSGLDYLVNLQFHNSSKNAHLQSQNQTSKDIEKYLPIKRIVFIFISDKILFEKKEDNHKSHHLFLETKSLKNYLKDLSFVFIELPKFTKKIEELVSPEDFWCFFFKNNDNLQAIQEISGAIPEIMQACNALKISENG